MSRPSPWVHGLGWDGFWMLSALWLAPVVLWLSRGYADPQEGPLDLVYFAQLIKHVDILDARTPASAQRLRQQRTRAREVFSRIRHLSH